MDRKKEYYDAFISYQHNPYTSRIAHTVLRRLEHYRPPKGLEAQKKKLYLFIDDQNLAAAGVLDRQICGALAHSEYLIYLACPETLRSHYCLDELRYFKKLHDGRLDNVIVLLVKGEPEDVFPRELCYEGCQDSEGPPDSGRETEVHWLDLRAGNIREALAQLNKSLLMIAAPLLHCELDDLIQRDKQWKKQKRMIWGMLGVTMSVIVLCAAYTFWLTWLADYKRRAENALADGNDNKALFYYAKTLSLNPADEEARVNAQILLQKEVWPAVVQEDEDSLLLGNRVYSADISAGAGDSFTPVCMTTEGSYILWRNENKGFCFSDAGRTFFRELPDTDGFSYFNAGRVTDAWSFMDSKEPYDIFYWPEEKRMEKLKWRENFSCERNNAGVCALRPGRIAVGDREALIFCQLGNDVCRELFRIELDEIFGDDEAVQEKYHISVSENYSFELWPSPDGSRLAVTANFWYHSATESFCRSAAALFDTETYRLITLVESQECLIYEITFQDDSRKMALIYNNEGGVLENRGYAAVYDCFGNLAFQTECGSSVIPREGFFCGDLFLLCDRSAAYFLDAETGMQVCEPLMLYVNYAALTDDGRIALECQNEVRYCRFIRYSGGIIDESKEKDMLNAGQREVEMKYRVADDLWLFRSDDGKEVFLADKDNRISDRFPIRGAENGNFIIAMAYGKSTQTAFVLDADRNLYGVPVHTELKKFAAGEDVSVHSGILGFDAAKHGAVCLDGFFPGYYYTRVSNLMYLTDDNFLFFHDPAVRYLGWIAEPDINDSFAGLISGESDYAVIVTRKEENLNFRFFSMKTGNFLVNMPYEAVDDLLVCLEENDIIFIRSGGNWRSMWLGLRRADRGVTHQLMDLSGYKLSGSRFKNNRKLEYANVVVHPDSFGSWSGYLERTYLFY